MSASQRKPSKSGSLTPAFVQAAVRDPEGALSHMMLASFGVTLASLMSIAMKAFGLQDIQIIIMAMTAGVQIRNHVVFVGREYGDVRAKYPELIIDGDREQRDIFNFGALHALGHVFAHVTGNDLGPKILSKAGSCVTGEKLTESEAGNINKEIYLGWTTEDKGSWAAWLATAQANHRGVLDPIVGTVPTRAKAFAASMAGPPGGSVPPRSITAKVPGI